MKILEKVAEAIYPHTNWGEPFDEASTADECYGAAQAAIDALDIIILPADAEPQEGDLVNARPNDPDASPFRFHGDDTQHKKLYIIQRNGKPVIQEGE